MWWPFSVLYQRQLRRVKRYAVDSSYIALTQPFLWCVRCTVLRIHRKLRNNCILLYAVDSLSIRQFMICVMRLFAVRCDEIQAWDSRSINYYYSELFTNIAWLFSLENFELKVIIYGSSWICMANTYLIENILLSKCSIHSMCSPNRQRHINIDNIIYFRCVQYTSKVFSINETSASWYYFLLISLTTRVEVIFRNRIIDSFSWWSLF